MATLQQLRQDFAAAKQHKSNMTFKQGGYLWRFTGCKFWEPEQVPAPYLKQASVMIDACIKWNSARGTDKQELAGLLEEFIQVWFPNWDRSKLFFRMKGHKPADKPQAAQNSSLPPFPALPDQENSKPENNNQDDQEGQKSGQDDQQSDQENQKGNGNSEQEQTEPTEQPEKKKRKSKKQREAEEEQARQDLQTEAEEQQKQQKEEQQDKPESPESDESKPDQPEPEPEPEPEQSKPEPKKKKKASKLDPKVLEMIKMIHAGIRNIWMVGAAGSGKTTMGGIVAENIDVPCTIISCGLGTSSVEFLGYKYPTREATPFAGAFGQPSIIILDEFTALDPAVAQVCNSALANGQITTTTGVVQRHPDCVIIATSNTFGDGADRQYVANQQLDAATIDRFMGGIIEVGYSKEYEARFDIEIRTYVLALRKLIKQHSFRRVASTRMMIQGEALKNGAFPEWRNRLIINWTEEEKSVIAGNLGVAMNEAQREAQGSEM